MRLKPIVWILTAIAAVVVIIAAVLLYPVFSYGFKNAAKRRNLTNVTDHTNILRQCITLHARLPSGTQLRANDPRLPTVISNLNPRYVVVSDWKVRVEFAGGFDHFGYVAEPDLSKDTNVWALYWYTEQGQKEMARMRR